jgi:hypothetical protein
MVSRRLVTAAVAVTVPIAVVNAVTITESAAVTPVQAKGSITCSYGTTLAFNPPLSRSPGTLVHSATLPNEVVTIARATLGKCTRSPMPTPAVKSGEATASVSVKIPGVKFGSNTWYVGDCTAFDQMLWAKMTTHFAWTGPTVPIVDSTLVTKSSSLYRAFGRLGFVASGTTAGSFPGTKSTITAFFTAASATAITNTCGGATTKVKNATISTLSTIHLGN